MFCVVFDSHWPPPEGCGPLCRFGPCWGRWPPRCHTVRQSSGPLRWPSDSPDLCAQIHSLILKAGLYWLSLPVTLSHFVYGGKTASRLLFNPTHYPPCFSIPPLCFPSSPCFLSYSHSLIPICCLIILPLPHTAPSPTPSLPSFTAHNPSHRGQVQITPRGRGFWVFRQRYYLTC